MQDDPSCSFANPMFSAIEQSDVGTVLAPGILMGFSTVGRLPTTPAPPLGEYTKQVLDELLGLNSAQYVSNGSTTFITNGSIADLLVLAVKTNPKGKAIDVSLFRFDTKTPGFRLGRRLRKIGLHGSDTCELFIDDCKVPAEALLGKREGQGFYQMMQDLTYERALVGVNCAAEMQHAFEVTRDYARIEPIYGGANELMKDLIVRGL